MELSPTQRAYVFVACLVIPSVANFVINGLLAWLMFSEDPLPVWSAGPSAGSDLIGTCFFLPLITCLIVTPLTRRRVHAGLVERLPAEARPGWARTLPSATFARALVFGVVTLLVVGSAVGATLWLLGWTEVGLTSFVFWKAVFSVVLGWLVTPGIGVAGLGDPAPAGVS